jgi:hypothetical protein
MDIQTERQVRADEDEHDERELCDVQENGYARLLARERALLSVRAVPRTPEQQAEIAANLRAACLALLGRSPTFRSRCRLPWPPRT